MRNFAASPAIGRILLLLTATGLLSACLPNEEVDTPIGTIEATSVALAPAPSPEEAEPSLIEPTIDSEQVEQIPAIQSTATGRLNPTASITPEAKPSPTDDSASPVIKIPLAGPVASRLAELSGLAWYGDSLILLPQFPDFNSDEADGFIYALSKADIISFLNGQINQPLEPKPVSFVAPGLRENIVGFEGYEAITFLGDFVYVTIESRTADGMLGYLAKGTISPDLSTLTLDTSTIATIAPQADVQNMSEESLFVADQVVGTIYELNGRGVNTSPIVHLFDLDLRPLESASFPNVEFRITDVSDLDPDGRFWAINYFFPGTGEVSETSGTQESNENGARTQPAWEGMGRLVEFQYTPSGITLTEAAPVQLESLLSDIHNWEGLARLDDRGFLIVSDEFPDTVLGFVPFQEAE